MNDFHQLKNNDLIWASFMSNGTPCINVWHVERKKAEIELSDRIVNAEASPGEHLRELTVGEYNSILVTKCLAFAMIRIDA